MIPLKHSHASRLPKTPLKPKMSLRSNLIVNFKYQIGVFLQGSQLSIQF